MPLVPLIKIKNINLEKPNILKNRIETLQVGIISEYALGHYGYTVDDDIYHEIRAHYHEGITNVSALKQTT